MTRIPLQCGTSAAIVDAADYEAVAPHRWFVIDSRGYVAAYIGGVRVRLHRFLLGVTDPAVWVDHVNRNPLDNRRANLRIASFAESGRNVGKRAGAASRFKGVTRYKRGWVARICVDGRRRYLGMYRSEDLAARAYDEAASRLFGGFAVLNFERAHEVKPERVEAR